ncbi:MAG: hypothetical protein J3K34DRAFT_435230 [Monoraphidium minutum]|nr:MAG: hypothetical protein J3K34DRAFT_435230 [Monoraphidium minutum]
MPLPSTTTLRVKGPDGFSARLTGLITRGRTFVAFRQLFHAIVQPLLGMYWRTYTRRGTCVRTAATPSEVVALAAAGAVGAATRHADMVDIAEAASALQLVGAPREVVASLLSYEAGKSQRAAGNWRHARPAPCRRRGADHGARPHRHAANGAAGAGPLARRPAGAALRPERHHRPQGQAHHYDGDLARHPGRARLARRAHPARPPDRHAGAFGGVARRHGGGPPRLPRLPLPLHGRVHPRAAALPQQPRCRVLRELPAEPRRRQQRRLHRDLVDRARRGVGVQGGPRGHRAVHGLAAQAAAADLPEPRRPRPGADRGGALRRRQVDGGAAPAEACDGGGRRGGGDGVVGRQDAGGGGPRP